MKYLKNVYQPQIRGSLFIKISSVLLFVLYIWYFKERVNQADFLVFYKAALAVRHHHSPYPPITSRSVYSGSSFVYPYLNVFFFYPFTFFRQSLAEWIYCLLTVSSIVAALLLLDIKDLRAWIVFLLASPVIVSWQMGTLNPLFVLGVAVVWRFKNYALIAGIVLAMIAFAKLFLVCLLLWPLIAKRIRLFVVSLAALVVIAIASFNLGPLSLVSYVSLLSRLSKHESISGYSTNALIRTFGLGQVGSELVVVALASALAVGVTILFRRSKNERFLLSGFLLISLLITPILWSSYLIIFGIALILAFPFDWAVAEFAVLSWIVVTPDRVQLPIVLLSIVIVIILSLWLMTSSRKLDLNSIQDVINEFFAFSARFWTIAAIPLVVITLVFLFDQHLAAIVAIQFSLLLLFPTGLAISQITDSPKPRINRKKLLDITDRN